MGTSNAGVVSNVRRYYELYLFGRVLRLLKGLVEIPRLTKQDRLTKFTLQEATRARELAQCRGFDGL